MNGRTRTKVILTFISAVMYVVWVFDALPDFIPVVGYLDDLAVLISAACSFIRGRERFRQRDDTDNSPWREVEP